MMWKRSSDGEAESRETLAAAAWMKELASLPVSEEPLPDPTYLWWKGELLRRWDAQQKATELIEVGEQVQVGLSLVAAAGLLVLARDGDRARLGPRSLGPASRFVVDHAPCPVLLVWPEPAPGIATIPPPPPHPPHHRQGAGQQPR